MENLEMTPAIDFCTYHAVSYSFIAELSDAGLIAVEMIQEQPFLHNEELVNLESLVRMHTELDINREGVEAIAHLLQRMKDMQQKLLTLEHRLNLYED